MAARWEGHLDSIIDLCCEFEAQIITATVDRKDLWDRIVEWVQDIECETCEYNRAPPDDDWRD